MSMDLHNFQSQRHSVGVSYSHFVRALLNSLVTIR
jgi:hypothetical protein